MILDDLDHADQYRRLGSRFARAFQFLRETDLVALAPGRHDIEGARVFALVSDYDTKPREASVWEAHRRHVDVQYVPSGRELVGVAPLEALDTQPYDADKDVLFATGAGEFVTLSPGRFVVLFPQDGHMPGVSIDGPQAVRKVVVKIAIEP
jgi:biofilm protein TabA